MKTIGHGYYWNDLEVGFTFRTLNRTITESDLVGFINTTGMLEMIFIDQSRAGPLTLPNAAMLVQRNLAVDDIEAAYGLHRNQKTRTSEHAHLQA